MKAWGTRITTTIKVRTDRSNQVTNQEHTGTKKG